MWEWLKRFLGLYDPQDIELKSWDSGMLTTPIIGQSSTADSSGVSSAGGVDGASDFYNWLTGDYQAQMEANRIAQQAQAEADREFQQNSANQAMQFSANEAQKSRDWQEMMSNTAYQRAVQDMRAAGINPILAYTQGGASTGSGAAGSGYAASGSRAEVDTSTVSQMFGSTLNSAASVVRGFENMTGSVLSGLLKLLG